MAAARELEQWRKTQEEALRRAEEARREAREWYIRETKQALAPDVQAIWRWIQALAHDVQAIWRWIPDWVKMVSVGLVLGAIVCIPIIAYMMKTGAAEVMPADTHPKAIAKVQQAAPGDGQAHPLAAPEPKSIESDHPPPPF